MSEKDPPPKRRETDAPRAKGERLAEALRANLARRKAQKRAREGARTQDNEQG